MSRRREPAGGARCWLWGCRCYCSPRAARGVVKSPSASAPGRRRRRNADGVRAAANPVFGRLPLRRIL